MATQREVAEAAGVSLAVVSAVVAGSTHTRMSEATRARVLAAMDRLGYRPNQAARSLRLSRTGMIGLVLHKLDNPVYEPMIRGIYAAAAEQGSAVLLGDAEMMQSGSEFLTRLLSQGTVDGILVRGDDVLDADVMSTLRDHPKPLLFLEPSDSQAWLGIDDRAAAQIATRFLINLGHRQVVFIGGADGTAAQQRYLGYRDTMADSGLAPGPHLATGYGERAGADGLRRGLGLSTPPTAVVVNNIMSCVGVLAAAHDLGLAVPEQLSVVGIHDVPLMEHLRPAITAVRMPMYELGRAGVTALYQMMSDGPAPNSLMSAPAPELIVRDSAVTPAQR